MPSENFSSKEILLQLMNKLDNLTTAVNKQDILLNTIHEASGARDEKIKDLKIKFEELEDKVEELKSFNKILVAAWSAVVLFVSIFGRDLINRIF